MSSRKVANARTSDGRFLRGSRVPTVNIYGLCSPNDFRATDIASGEAWPEPVLDAKRSHDHPAGIDFERLDNVRSGGARRDQNEIGPPHR